MAPDPPHDRSRYKEAWLDRQVDGPGTRLPDLRRHIAGEAIPIHRKISDNTLALTQTRVVSHRATDGKAREGANREWHRDLAGRPIFGEEQSIRKMGYREMIVLRGDTDSFRPTGLGLRWGVCSPLEGL